MYDSFGESRFHRSVLSVSRCPRSVEFASHVTQCLPEVPPKATVPRRLKAFEVPSSEVDVTLDTLILSSAWLSFPPGVVSVRSGISRVVACTCRRGVGLYK